jgi:hypothetical protein
MTPETTTTGLLVSVFFGALGAGYALYGRKQRAVVPLLCGLGLMVFPYFVLSTPLLLLIGAVIALIPRFYSYP